jgi:hypothetical protein
MLNHGLTPFRERYRRAGGLGLDAQLKECVEYLENPEVLVTEFLESYYLVERESHPSDETMRRAVENVEELVLEPFFDSLQLFVEDDEGGVERLLCAGGAFDPIPVDQHPALGHQGLDYVGLRGASSRIVLGVTTNPKERSPFQMLLRGLNCFAEIAPPFQLARLRSQVIRDRIDPDAVFDLQLASTLGEQRNTAQASLYELTRDLAEVFRTLIDDHDQFEGTLGQIEYLDCVDGEDSTPSSLRLRWRV